MTGSKQSQGGSSSASPGSNAAAASTRPPAGATRRPLVAGNWKMNGTREQGAALAAAVVEAASAGSWRAIDCVVFPAFPYLAQVVAALGAGSTGAAPVALGAQDMSPNDDGAYTGDVSASMLADIGCQWVLIGHSERRAGHGETSRTVADKARQAFAHGLKPLICIGESLETRQAGRTESFLAEDLDGFVAELKDRPADSYAIGYEPIWAIGTGVTATPQQAQDTHAFIRSRLAAAGLAADQVRIVYGGSVKASNAAELFSMPDVDGGLVGGASLVAADFVAIGEAAVRLAGAGHAVEPQTTTGPSSAQLR